MRIRRLLPIMTAALVLLSALFIVIPQAVHAECDVYHTVSAGQNLFRISLRYGVNLYDIAAANNISNVALIYVGQKLYIPCTGSATGSTTTTTTTTTITTITTTTGIATPTGIATSSVVATVTPVGTGTPTAGGCTGFRATSPLDGFHDGTTTFYWDEPRAAATEVIIYQVIVLDDQGRRVASFDTAGQISRINGDVSFNNIGGRSRFSWFVIAISRGVELCRTQTVTVNREWNQFAGISP